jgi:2-amino-4-hydroxy-6-hydroxymethyldihydropteridine diphosphokinase
METAYIALGSNLPSRAGTPVETLRAALVQLGELGTVTAQSRFHETAPVGYADQPVFLNAVAALETALEPQALLEGLLEIERSFGRDRTHSIPSGPRTLDLDLLLYGDQILSTPALELPHPRMTARRFVLVPLQEIAPRLIHPVLNKTVSQLIDDLPQTKEVLPHGGR